MSRCVKLFGKKHSEFIRVFLFENKSKLEHFKSGLLVNRLLFDCNGELISDAGADKNSKKLSDFLIAFNLPTEFVFFHRSMACKLFSTKISEAKNINKVAQHALNDSHCNTVFYGRLPDNKSNVNFCINRKFTYGLCTCDILDTHTKLFLDNTYRLKIISTSVFPLWVVSTFLSHCKCKALTFALFVIDYLDYLHIILANNGYVIYNRSVALENRDKDSEVRNTLNHIKNVINLNISDIVIYEFGDSVVDYLSSCSTMRMKMISTGFSIKPRKRIENNIFKIACLVFSGMLFSDALTNVYKINKLNKQTDYIKTKINNSQIAKDIDAWCELHSNDLLNQPDYKKAIKEYTSHRTEKLQNITMYCDEGNKISITEDPSDVNDSLNSNIVDEGITDINNTTNNIEYDVITNDNIDINEDNSSYEDSDDEISNDSNDIYEEDDYTEDNSDDAYKSDYYVDESVIVNA